MGYDVVALGELLIDFTSAEGSGEAPVFTDRKSTRLNSSH